MEEAKIYIGSGVEKFEGNLIEQTICLSDIPKEHIFEYNGKKYLKIKTQKKQQVDQFGKSHSVSINTFKPKPKDNIASEPPVAKTSQPTPEEFKDDLPF